MAIVVVGGVENLDTDNVSINNCMMFTEISETGTNCNHKTGDKMTVYINSRRYAHHK